MTDQELRDKLATEFVREGGACVMDTYQDHEDTFKAGWDAAESHFKNELNHLRAETKGLHTLNKQHRAEVEQLKDDGETWQGHAEANHALLMRTEEERDEQQGYAIKFQRRADQLKAQCEKLAETLAHLYECELQEWGKEEWEVDEKDTSALGKAKQVLAEYCKQFPKDKE